MLQTSWFILLICDYAVYIGAFKGVKLTCLPANQSLDALSISVFVFVGHKHSALTSHWPPEECKHASKCLGPTVRSVLIGRMPYGMKDLNDVEEMNEIQFRTVKKRWSVEGRE